MKIKSLFFLTVFIVIAVLIASCQPQGGKVKLKDMKTDADSASYAIGVIIGLQNQQILQNFPGADNLSIDIITKVFHAVLEKKDTTDGNTANEILGIYLDNISKVEGQKNLEEGNAFLEKNKAKKGIQITDSGLQYEIITEGTGPKPTVEDVVKVHYHGTFINGEVFDSSVDRGQPVEFPLTGVIPGWTEGLQLMPVGSKWKLYIPGHIAYGEGGDQYGRIGPNVTLIFEVELLDIIPQTEE
ncbi:MAG: FKBP-type peptidyl-prolyl cis-trans isomerase [Prolixibacteraceae bacterium]|nr:FKBP-type peptidyl-prolyl cis-trans isomerase [Prolixibacteraceae bacterium]